MSMRRRSVLAAIGTALATTGCLGAGSPADGTNEPTDTPTGTPTQQRTPTQTPDDGLPDSIANTDCPAFGEADRTVCSHTRPDDATVYLTVSSPVFRFSQGDDTVETVPFTLHDEGDRPFGFNPYAWAVKRQTADGWRHVAPEAYPEPWTTIGPGETYEWELSTETHPSPNLEHTHYPIVPDLESGLHAFVVSGILGEGEEAVTVEANALFEVVASDSD
ncbi:hypothetical protein ACKVMT_00130 [Halobacteriales archaeon Cl-PHB]